MPLLVERLLGVHVDCHSELDEDLECKGVVFCRSFWCKTALLKALVAQLLTLQDTEWRVTPDGCYTPGYDP